jgi:WD40 repeat protein
VQDLVPALQTQSSPKHTLRHAHGARISALCFNPSGPILAAGDVRGVLVLWDTHNLWYVQVGYET